jgi:iron complex outermembrane receptor protein
MRYLFVFFYLFLSTGLGAQITGQIKDVETGTALVGAVVFHQSDTSISNEYGRFQLKPFLNEENVLTVRYIGYKTRVFSFSPGDHFLLISLEPNPEEIQEITIMATLIKQKPKTMVSSLGIVKSDILRLDNPVNIAESLNSTPGVFMAEGNKNTNRIIIRGMGSRTPYSSNRVKAYLDDIPISTGDGTTVMEDIDVSGISRIEILKGPSSSVYGSGLGGTIKLYSDSPLEKALTFSGRSEISSFNSFRNTLKLAFRGDNTFVNTGFNQFTGDGFRENSKYLRNNAMINGSVNFKKLELNFYSAYIQVDAEIPSSLDFETFQKSPSSAAQNWLNVNGKEQYSRFIGGMGLNFQMSEKLNLKTTLFTNYRDANENRPFNNLSENSLNYGLRSIVNFSHRGINAALGSELFTETYSWSILETIEGESGELINKNREERKYLNVFALFNTKLSQKVILESGMNFNLLSYRIDDQFLSDGNDISGSFKYDNIFSPRIGLVYLMNMHNLYGNIGHGFSHPSLEETLTPAGERNTDIQPEKAWNYEIGFRGPLLSKKIYFDLSFYRIDLKNIIVTKRQSEEIFFGINAGKTRHYGLELFSQFMVYQQNETAKVFMDFSYSMSQNQFLDFVDDGKDFSGNFLPGIPSYNLSTSLRAVHKSGISLYLKFRSTGRQYLNDDNNSSYGNYALTNIKFQYETKKFNHFGIKLHAGIDNLFDKRYASMILVNAPSFNGSLPRYYYPGQFRTFLFGFFIEVNSDG